MTHKITKATALLVLPVLLSACQSGTTTSATTTTAATTVATQGIAPTATTLRQFPTTITGGDGFQANPTNDASFATLINAVRADAGAAPLTYNAQLDTAAQAHSDDMLAQNYFSHTGLNGSTAQTRAAAAGYTGGTIGENIAQGQENENVVMNAWINSAGHQENNVRTSFKEFGLGRAGTGSDIRWTLMFGAQ